jgi:hypothetical protein
MRKPLTEEQKAKRADYDRARRLGNEEKIHARSAAYYAANKEKMKVYGAEYYRTHKEKVLARTAARQKSNRARSCEYTKKWNRENKEKIKVWVKANPERIAAINARWTKANAGKVNAKTARRNARLINATPAWANKFFISEIYDLASRRTRAFGFPWHVDHITPLRSSIVCGLHVECNLQVIPGVENVHKGNRVWPDMPGEIHEGT